MHSLRTHTCGELRREHAGATVRLSGWVHRKRDHGNLLFLDVRDHYGITQCVLDGSSPLFRTAEGLRLESVITLTGQVVPRAPAAVNPRLPTGEIELTVAELVVQSMAEPLPLQVNSEAEFPEETRLRHRFLDLRREKLHRNIVLRSRIIASIRRRMIEAGFTELQTPILTSSSPEGARDYLVPSRVHPGKFYALPQAPQQFKQLLMTAGFDRYFQIAPCFRDEDGRADRSPGEFYQLDFEMSFVTQEDVFAAIEPVLHGVFEEFAGGATVTPAPFPRIPFAEAMTAYGSDKPDLRNPIRIADVTDVFRGSEFAAFATAVAGGAVVRAVPGPGAARQPRSFFDKLGQWAREQGAPGLGYVVLADGGARGPIAKFVDGARLARLIAATGARDGDALFFVCDQKGVAEKLAGRVRTRLGDALGDGLSDVRVERGHQADRVQPQPVLDAAGRTGGARGRRPADDQGVPVRHRLQRGRALQRRDPQPSPRHHVQGVRDRGLPPRGGRGPLRGNVERVQVRRAPARRLGPGHRPHRDAARRRDEHS